METDATQIEMENHLRAKRQALALSQKQLADLAGITRQAVSALEAKSLFARHVGCTPARAGAALPGRGSFQPQERRRDCRRRAARCHSPRHWTVESSGNSDRSPTAGAPASWARRASQPKRHSGRPCHRVKPRYEPGKSQITERSRSRTQENYRGRMRSGDVFSRRACQKARSGKLGALSDGQQHRPCSAKAR